MDNKAIHQVIMRALHHHLYANKFADYYHALIFPEGLQNEVNMLIILDEFVLPAISEIVVNYATFDIRILLQIRTSVALFESRDIFRHLHDFRKDYKALYDGEKIEFLQNPFHLGIYDNDEFIRISRYTAKSKQRRGSEYDYNRLF